MNVTLIIKEIKTILATSHKLKWLNIIFTIFMVLIFPNETFSQFKCGNEGLSTAAFTPAQMQQYSNYLNRTNHSANEIDNNRIRSTNSNSNSGAKTIKPGSYVIPVVFHVIGNNANNKYFLSRFTRSN